MTRNFFIISYKDLSGNYCKAEIFAKDKKSAEKKANKTFNKVIGVYSLILKRNRLSTE
jgi:hypothetical protein